MAGKPTSEEVVKLMANTKQLVDKQAKYKKWKENHMKELEVKFNKQTTKIDNLDKKLGTQD
eukprot:9231861-Ditylum_brightwellii.AAC.1